jgi:hypothetical protein
MNAIEQAIEQEIADTYPGGIITGYVWMAVVQDPTDFDTTTHYPRGTGAAMDSHSAVGLARRLFRTLDDEGFDD